MSYFHLPTERLNLEALLHELGLSRGELALRLSVRLSKPPKTNRKLERSMEQRDVDHVTRRCGGSVAGNRAKKGGSNRRRRTSAETRPEGTRP